MLEGETPADFHAGRETGAESWNCQSGEPDEGCYIRDLNGPQTKAVLTEMLLNAIDQRVALSSTEAIREEFHDARV